MNIGYGSVFLPGDRKERKPLIAQFSTCEVQQGTEMIQL
jgi:hypothetical protein